MIWFSEQALWGIFSTDVTFQLSDVVTIMFRCHTVVSADFFSISGLYLILDSTGAFSSGMSYHSCFFFNFRRFPEAGQTLLQDQHHGESIKVSVETQSFPNGELPGELRASNSNCFYFTSTYDRIKSCTEASVSFSISFNPHSLIGGVEISKERTVWNWFWSEGSEGWREILSHVSPFKDCISKLFLHLHTFCIGSCTRLIDILLLLYTSLKFLLSSKLWAGHFGVCGSAV